LGESETGIEIVDIKRGISACRRSKTDNAAAVSAARSRGR
jgi:hypothetical protein